MIVKTIPPAEVKDDVQITLSNEEAELVRWALHAAYHGTVAAPEARAISRRLIDHLDEVIV